MFDPYRKWLGIPDGQRPPTHYQLLGIAPDERDRDVINAAVVRQSAFIRTFQNGQHAAEATRLLNEIAAAKVCLLDPAKRAQYDANVMKAGPSRHATSADRVERLSASSRPAPSSGRGASKAETTPTARPQPAALEPIPPRAVVASSPAPLVPADLWSSVESAPLRPVLGGVRKTRTKPPYWLLFIPVGSIAFALIALLVVVLTRHPTTTIAGPQTSQPPAHESGLVSGAVRASAPSVTENPQTVARVDQGASSARAMPGSSIMPPATPRSDPLPTGPVRPGEDWLCVDPQLLNVGKKFSLPVPRASLQSAPIVFASAHGPFVAIGSVIYNLANGEVSGKIMRDVSGNHLRALSADGRYYAMVDRFTVEVLDCSNGACVAQLKAGRWGTNPSANITFIDFTDKDRLITSTRLGLQVIQLWELATGKPLQAVEVYDQPMAVTGDGRLLAALHSVSRHEIGNAIGRPINLEVPSYFDPRPLISNTIEGGCFSALGNEAAAVWETGRRVLAWNDDGKPIFDYRGADQRAYWNGSNAYYGPPIECHPGGRGWLLYGHVFLDRRYGRVTWILKTDQDNAARHRFIDSDRLLVCRGSGDKRELVDVKIPWGKIDASLEVMNKKNVPAWLRPHQRVSLRVDVPQGRGATRLPYPESHLSAMFHERWSLDEIEKGEGTPTFCVCEYSEKYAPARSLPQTAAGSLPKLPGVRPHKRPPHVLKAQTICTIHVRLRAEEASGDIWTNTLWVSAEDDGDATPRPAIYKALAPAVRGCLLPYFLPKDESLLALPAVIRP